MNIKDVKITNFKGIKEEELTPGKVTVFIGNNGAGKSSTMGAIKYLVTGDLPNEPIKYGETKMTVEGNIDGIDIIRGIDTTKSAKSIFKVNGKNTTVKSFNELINSTTAMSISCIKAMTSSEIMNMNPAAFTDFLLKVTPLEIDYARFLSFCGTISSDAEMELSMIFPAAGKFTLTDVENAYKYFDERRRVVAKNTEIKKLQATYNGPIPTRTIETVSKELDAILKKEGELSGVMASLSAYNKLLESKTKLESQIKDLTVKLNALSSVSSVKETDFTNIESEKAETQKKITEASSLIRILDSNVKKFEQTLAALNEGKCPISKGDCLADMSSVKEETSSLITENNKQLDISKSHLEKLEFSLKELLEKEKRLRIAKEQYQAKINLAIQIENLKKNVPVLPTKPVSVVSSCDLTAKKNELEAEKKNITLYNEHLKVQSQYEECLAELAVANEITSLLAPKNNRNTSGLSIREKILEYAITPFEEYINKRAELLKTGFSIKFDCTDGVKVLCEPCVGGGFLPFDNISNGEKVFVIFLITDMINALSGSSVLMLDDLNHLDKSNIESFMNLITNSDVLKSYDHIFLAMAKHDDIENAVKLHKEIDIVEL